MEKTIATSIGAVPYILDGNNIKYLLLFRKNSRIWEFPQGHIEEGESEQETLQREFKEETSLCRYEIQQGFYEEYVTIDRHDKKKNVNMYIIEFVDEDIVLSQEHSNYTIVSYENAKEMLSSDWRKELLDKAHTFLTAKLNKSE